MAPSAGSGMLLVDKVTEQLFETAGIEGIESCSPEGGFMTSVWTGRRRTVELSGSRDGPAPADGCR